jgi:hypothetical protein
MQSEAICAPIVTLSSLVSPCDDQKEILLWSTGGTFSWSYNSSEVHGTMSMLLFDYSNIHGFSVHNEVVVAFGDKSVAILIYDGQNFKIRCRNQALDDVVLDCNLIHSTPNLLTLVIGYAHNFYDVMQLHCENNEWVLQKRYQCQEKVTLFSVSFFIDIPVSDNSFSSSSSENIGANNIIVASGDLFGKLTLWKGNDELKDENNYKKNKDKIFSSKLLGSIKEHEGVIFRIIWGKSQGPSSPYQKIITVSDDRTARVWNISKEIPDSFIIQPFMTVWGHVSRVWDAVFINSDESWIATCSEDSTIKVWNEKAEAVSTMNGHLGSIWRIIKMKTVNCLVTSSNESSIKSWNIDYQLNNSPVKEDSTIFSCLIPVWPVIEEEKDQQKNDINDNQQKVEVDREEGEEIDDLPIVSKKKKSKSKLHNNKRNNGVCSVSILSDGKHLLVTLIAGQIWLVKLSPDSITTSFKISEWIPVTDLQKSIITSDVSSSLAEEKHLQVIMVNAFVDCTAIISSFSIDFNKSEVALQQQMVWKPHDQKAVNVWIQSNYSFATNNDSDLFLMTTSLNGICKLWKYNFKTNSQMILLATFQTERNEIVSSFYYKSSAKLSYYIIGDSRGGVNLFNRSSLKASTGTEEQIIKPSYYFNKAHSTDPVSGIIGTKNGFITIGHDNTMNFFEEFSISNLDSADTDTVVWWKMVNSMLTLPVSTPDKIFLVSNQGDEETEEDVGLSSIYISGYHGSSYIIYDIRKNYQLMRIEGGGWKRPHDCYLFFSSVSSLASSNRSNTLPVGIFACPAPVGKTETELQIVGSDVVDSFLHPPIHLNRNGFSKVSYCSVMIQSPRDSNSQLLAVGGEDCTMKVYSYPSLRLLQETSLSKNSSLKALSTASFNSAAISSPTKGIVVGGGGKLLYYVWLYDFNRYYDNRDTSSLVSSSFAPLQKIYVGNVSPKASQDHRIMSVNVTFLNYHCDVVIPSSSSSSTDFPCDVYQCLIILTDSRGFVSIVDFQYFDYKATVISMYQNDRNWNRKYCSVVQHLMEISSSPVLSSHLMELPRCSQMNNGDCDESETRELQQSQVHQIRFFMLAAGDTKGVINVLLLPVRSSLDFSLSISAGVENPFIR